MKKVLLGLLALSAVSFAATTTYQASTPVNVFANVTPNVEGMKIVDKDGVEITSLDVDHGSFTSGESVTNEIEKSQDFKVKVGTEAAISLSTAGITTSFSGVDVNNVATLNNGTEEVYSTLEVVSGAETGFSAVQGLLNGTFGSQGIYRTEGVTLIVTYNKTTN